MGRNYVHGLLADTCSHRRIPREGAIIAMSEIVKIQRPLSGDMTRALVYNRSESICQFTDWSDDLRRLFKDRTKMYFRAHLRENGQLVLDKVLAHQDW